MQTQEQLYVRGFNHGYILAKYLPELVTKLIKTVAPITDYTEGFFSGKEEYEIEYTRAQIDELNNLRNRSKDQDRDLGQ